MDEPKIKVGVMERCSEVRGRFNGLFRIHENHLHEGDFCARIEAGRITLTDAAGTTIFREKEIRCKPLKDFTFTLFDVTIGIQFHWERKQEQTFQGVLTFICDGNESFVAINEISLEDYLSSVISSEMSPGAPLEFLKAHAVTSRSWLMAMLQRSEQEKERDRGLTAPHQKEDEIIRWHDRVDHRAFDVCADDHCQRYQGITRVIASNVRRAIDETRGVFVVYGNKICDARYHKACGGRTDNFENTWEDTPVPYLSSVSDSPDSFTPLCTEEDTARWIHGRPDVYCNIEDVHVLQRILPSFDQETTDFFRWEVVFTREELEDIIRKKSGMDLGTLLNLTPVERGPSGRIIRLRIEGSKRTVTVGKELEIRRWLSRNHLYSSAFIVSVKRDLSGLPTRFTLQGAGWGHGVGLCQIGAAAMSMRGHCAEEILKHYFRQTEVQKLY